MLSWNGRSTQVQTTDCSLHHQGRGEARRWLGGLVAILVSTVILGCGETHETVPTGEATGKITVGGKPLTQGRVNFVSDAVGAAYEMAAPKVEVASTHGLLEGVPEM